MWQRDAARQGAYRVGPELDNGRVVEGVDLPGEGQLPGSHVCLIVVLGVCVVMWSGFFEHILNGTLGGENEIYREGQTIQKSENTELKRVQYYTIFLGFRVGFGENREITSLKLQILYIVPLN